MFHGQSRWTADLTEDTSALFVVGSSDSPAAVTGALRPFKGKVYQTSLDPEEVAAIEEALRREQ